MVFAGEVEGGYYMPSPQPMRASTVFFLLFSLFLPILQPFADSYLQSTVHVTMILGISCKIYYLPKKPQMLQVRALPSILMAVFTDLTKYDFCH